MMEKIENFSTILFSIIYYYIVKEIGSLVKSVWD